MTSGPLSERTRRILACLVKEYIDTGEPVASAALCRRPGLGVSSATIRNVLAQLEDMGYVHQPHTSAGRVPTDLGYRYFVDMLLDTRRTAARNASTVEARLREQAGETPLFDHLLSSASHVLFEVSHHVGFAIAPADQHAIFQRIEFVPLSGSRVLVVTVARGNHVSQKVIDTTEEIAPSALSQAANYLNDEFAGLPLAEVRQLVIARLEQERTLYDRLREVALTLARTTLEGIEAPTAVFIDGTSSLAAGNDASPVALSTLRTLLRMVEEKQRLVCLLDAYLEGPGVAVVIGTEHHDPQLRGCSMVVASYGDGARRGAVGVIGPTRMHYSRAISAVDGAAVAVARFLRDQN
jgi:heat-inducible transcriptional repressor